MPRLEVIQRLAEIAEEEKRDRDKRELEGFGSRKKIWKDIEPPSRLRRSTSDIESYLVGEQFKPTGDVQRDFQIEWHFAGDDEDSQKRVFDKYIKKLAHRKFGSMTRAEAAQVLLKEVARIEKRRV